MEQFFSSRCVFMFSAITACMAFTGSFLIGTFKYGLIFLIILDDRKDGIWVRVLFAEVAPSQILLAHFIVNIIFAAILSLIVFWFGVFYSRLEYHKNCTFFLLYTILLLMSLAGIVFGLLVSLICDSLLAIPSCFVGLTFIVIFINGKKF